MSVIALDADIVTEAKPEQPFAAEEIDARVEAFRIELLLWSDKEIG